MSKPSQRIINGLLLKLHYSLSNPSSSKFQSTSLTRPYSISSSLYSRISKPTSSNGVLSHLLQNPTPNFPSLPLRHYSFKPSSDFGKKLFENPSKLAASTFAKYRAAIGLQIDAFWKRNLLFLIGAGGIAVCALLWRIMFGIANTFVGVSEGMAKYGFLALSSAIVAFAGLYIRARITINPDRVYRIAMRKLNTSAGILEVMGAPLTGTELRAYVMSGGGVTLKNFKAKLRSKRCFLIFPIQGSERKGLVSVEVKKKKGKYDMKLLAVDIPMASGPDQRLFIFGDEAEYKIGGGLIAELRDPVVKAMAATKEFDDLDRIEEEEDAEKELQEAEIKHREEIEKLERGGS
ncbi:hypothetical protein M5689_002372 [Euphorbia peplus]|nr:hypothetical protein M5689_002372 [Euphorbia peplus]